MNSFPNRLTLSIILWVFANALSVAATTIRNDYDGITNDCAKDPNRYFATTCELFHSINWNEITTENSFDDILYILSDFADHTKYPDIIVTDKAIVAKGEAISHLLNIWTLNSKLQNKVSADKLVSTTKVIRDNLLLYKIKDYQDKPIYLHPPVPPGIEGFTGMNPDLIPDPQKREQYKKALEENRTNAIENNLQLMIQKNLERIDECFASFQVQKKKAGF